VGWFNTPGRQFAPESFPVFILDCPERGNFYGFPEQANEGFKNSEDPKLSPGFPHPVRSIHRRQVPPSQRGRRP
jgi:hypothetical protein